jgi:hypothetical protein
LYSVHIILEIDADTITRWLAWIRFFDFTVKYVPGNKHTAADGLSWRPATEKERKD